MNNPYGYIYETTNLLNNKKYIGQKKGKFNGCYYGSGLILKKAIQKHGIGSFNIKVLTSAENKAKLDELERSYIAEYRRIFGRRGLYNIANGGINGDVLDIRDKTYEEVYGKKKAAEIKKKIGEASRGHILSQEGKDKISKALSGKPKSEEHRAKLRVLIAPRETRKCQCSSECTETFVCKVTSEKRFIQKHINRGENNPSFGMDRSGENGPTYGHKWMHKDIDEKLVKADDILKYEQLGWVFGRISDTIEHRDKLHQAQTGRRYIYNKEINKSMRVKEKDAPTYINNGWIFGRGLKLTY
jgi:hypothetical protein